MDTQTITNVILRCCHPKVLDTIRFTETFQTMVLANRTHTLLWTGLTVIALQLLRIARYIFHPLIVFLPIIYFNLTLPVTAEIPGL